MQFHTGIFLALAVLLSFQERSTAAEISLPWLLDQLKNVQGYFSTSQAKDAHSAVFGENNSGKTSSGVSDTDISPASGTPVTPSKNTGSHTRELIAAAAGFEAMRMYERHQAKQTGQPVNHSIMKNILAGLAAAAVERLVETKGLDLIDAQKAKAQAIQTVEHIAEEKYGKNYGDDGSTPPPYRMELPAVQDKQKGKEGNSDLGSPQRHVAEATTSAGEYR
ncbi:hypothetical protein RvY_08067 [Ramazzottius varieornatus]|uniref:Uncharacterized protein n=1 Tax=Ramazzottius varieornatus TaxID=947166 RepID=A0A1D1V4G8_RAMVA|nr:hypothetical protein RvY_08067 [Ramazzottius varieornatus]